jgi:hypothetical protein
MRHVWLLVIAACGQPTTDPELAPDGMTNEPDEPDGRLYPLALDRTWTYDVLSTYASCPGGRREQRVVGMQAIEGRETFEVAGFCGLSGRTFVDGDRVEEYYDWGPTGWYRSLDEPVVDGHTWTTTNGSATFTQTYEELGAFAGHADCWKVTQNVAYTSYWIYCRGIGLVKYEMVDLAGGKIRAELHATSFREP